MQINRVKEYIKKTHRKYIRSLKKNLYYVSDSSKWAFYWIGYYLSRNIGGKYRKPVHLINNAVGFRNQVIHFGDRYAYLKDQCRYLHPSNRVLMTWFHGSPSSDDQNLKLLCSLLPEASEHLDKIVVSCDISKHVLEELGIPPEKLVKIPLGVDLDRFSPVNNEQRLLQRSRFMIPENSICIGSFQKDGVGWENGNEPKMIKGPDIFLEVMDRLYNRFKNIVVILSGPARGYIKKGLDKIGVPYVHENLNDYFDIVSLYQILDLYLICSREEGGPLSLLESWACGIPVVSTKVGMPADMIRNGENGFIAEVEDVEHLTEYTSRMIEQPELREKFRLKFSEEVKKYDWSMIASQYYEKLYLPCLQKLK